MKRLMAGLIIAFMSIATPVWADLATDLEKAEYIDNEFLKDEMDAVKRASVQWAKSLNAHDPIKVVAMYDEPFILYATFKSKIDTHEDLLKYFKALVEKKDLKVVFNEQNIRVHGPAAIDSGLYTFSYNDNGTIKEIPARFTFVYALTPNGWRIVDHHSSVLPD